MRMHLQGEIPIWEFHWKPGAQCLGMTGSAAEDGTHEDPEHVENKKAVVRQKINILNVNIVGNLSFEASLLDWTANPAENRDSCSRSRRSLSNKGEVPQKSQNDPKCTVYCIFFAVTEKI